MRKIIIITGQTATGKTKLALQKAIEENGELINADSRQIYKKLNIITGKDLPKNSIFHLKSAAGKFQIGYYSFPVIASAAKNLSRMREVSSDKMRIWLYDTVDLKQHFSSFDFQTCALTVVKDILSRGKTPIIVGGTYFYLYHLLYDVETQNIPPNWVLRKQLNNRTVEQLQKILTEENRELFESLNESDRNNPQRLIRKIEISNYLSSRGSPPNRRGDVAISSTKRSPVLQEKLNEEIDIKYIGLRFKNKESLHTAIEKRVKERLKNGAIEEVKQLLKEGYTANDPGIKTIGYQQFIKYLQGKNSKEQAIEEWKIREHQYAKRQYTFMKKDENIKWLEV
ncbi:hypothetical protein HY358_01290 [Candidatus Roizmanbacteria bacterium]|nr:hypothetical protein [Candidatus Roizmanbacteria bacterium]